MAAKSINFSFFSFLTCLVNKCCDKLSKVVAGHWAVLCKASEVLSEYPPQQLAVLQGPQQQQSCYQEPSDLLEVKTRVGFVGWSCGAHCNHTSRVLPEALPS